MTDFGFETPEPEGEFLRETTDTRPILILLIGSIYCFSGSTTVEIFRSLTVPNPLGWSPDKSTMYYVHSTTREVLALNYSVSDGIVSRQRVLYPHKGPGVPDGSRVDVEGNL